METPSIVVLDFGAQYSQLIARRVREQNVFSVVLPCNATVDEIKKHTPIGIILSGGPSSVYDKDAPTADLRVFDLGLPVLGICYGLQFMAQNIMIGTVDGDIYYVRNGRVPIRPKGCDSSKPMPGATGACEWRGIHPFDDLVQITNPPQGYMQNCNVSPNLLT